MLLPADRSVSNSLRLDDPRRLFDATGVESASDLGSMRGLLVHDRVLGPIVPFESPVF